MEAQLARIEALRRHLSDEICRAIGLSEDGWYYGPIDRLFRIPTRRFAELGERFDEWASSWGFVEAANRVLPRFASSFEAYGVEHIPSEGPLLVTANHPGTCDALLIAASVGRDDLKIVSGNIGFLRELPVVKDHLLFLTRDTHQRMGILRTAIRHLRDGGMVLIFPSGHIDPDPAVLPGGHEALSDWSPSVELMLRRAPEARVLVAIVSGVLAAACVRSPLTRVRKKARDRQRVAEFIQIIEQLVFNREFPLLPKVSFAEPVTLTDLREVAGFSGAVEALVARARAQMARHTALGAAAPP